MMSNKMQDFVRALCSIQPMGNNALRDSVGKGVGIIKKKNEQFVKQGDKRKFLHIVLTNGEDNSSKISIEKLRDQLQISKILKGMIQTHFIGININSDSKAQRELFEIQQISSETSQLHVGSIDEISNFFSSINDQINSITTIKGEDSIITQQEIYQPHIQQQNVSSYIVLFNLNISESMSGDIWDKVCLCIYSFVSNLGSEDQIGAIIFNEKVHEINLNKTNYGLPPYLVRNSQIHYQLNRLQPSINSSQNLTSEQEYSSSSLSSKLTNNLQQRREFSCLDCNIF